MDVSEEEERGGRDVPSDAVEVDVLAFDERVARLLQTATEEEFDRLGEMRSVLRVHVLDSLWIRVSASEGKERTTDLETLEGALTPTEEVLVGEEIVLPLLCSSKRKHDLNHLQDYGVSTGSAETNRRTNLGVRDILLLEQLDDARNVVLVKLLVPQRVEDRQAKLRFGQNVGRGDHGLNGLFVTSQRRTP